MRIKRARIVWTAVAMAWLSPGPATLTARGAIVVTSGTLHATAHAFSDPVDGSMTPADVNFVAPSTTHGATASAFTPLNGTASSNITETVSNISGISISGSGGTGGSIGTLFSNTAFA